MGTREVARLGRRDVNKYTTGGASVAGPHSALCCMHVLGPIRQKAPCMKQATNHGVITRWIALSRTPMGNKLMTAHMSSSVAALGYLLVGLHKKRIGVVV